MDDDGVGGGMPTDHSLAASGKIISEFSLEFGAIQTEDLDRGVQIRTRAALGRYLVADHIAFAAVSSGD